MVMQKQHLHLHHKSVRTPTAVILPAMEFLRVSVALVVDGVDQGEEVKSHPPTASFMSLILVATPLVVVSHGPIWYNAIHYMAPYGIL